MPDSPNTAGSIYSTAEQLAYYDSLPTMLGAAAALFTRPAGHVLLVKPTDTASSPLVTWPSTCRLS